MLDPFQLPYVQQGLLEILVLSVAAGLLGTWIVLRGLAFYAHAVGTAAFPGLVLAEGVGFAAPVGAFAAAAAFTAGVATLSGQRRAAYDSTTALVLVGCLAGGVILASDVFNSGSNVETLLFGSLLLIESRDVLLAGVASVLAAAGTWALGRHWLAFGFDPGAARALGVRPGRSEPILLALIALATVAALSAVGALLTTALFVVPAATTRLWTNRFGAWQLATVALVAAEGTVGLWLSVQSNAPPGAAIATLSSAVFVVALVARHAMRGRVGAAAVAVAACVALAGCGSSSSSDSGRLRVVATTTQVADFARAVGGDAVDVHQILRPNTDPHEYEPRPADIEATAKAQVVLTSGDGLDHWIGKVVKESGGHPRVVDLGVGRPVTLPDESGGTDPHWWHDPANARHAVERARDAILAAYPKDAAAVRSNADAYLRRLESVTEGIAGCIHAVPREERKLVTDHDAFGYFAHRFGIKVVGALFPSQTIRAQPSGGDLARLRALVQREHVHAIFPESSLSPRLANALASATGAEVGEALYGDTLGPKGSDADTYLRMEASNASAMSGGFTAGGESVMKCLIFYTG